MRCAGQFAGSRNEMNFTNLAPEVGCARSINFLSANPSHGITIDHASTQPRIIQIRAGILGAVNNALPALSLNPVTSTLVGCNPSGGFCLAQRYVDPGVEILQRN